MYAIGRSCCDTAPERVPREIAITFNNRNHISDLLRKGEKNEHSMLLVFAVMIALCAVVLLGTFCVHK